MNDKCQANRCVRCNVNSCENHCQGEDFCSLDCVCIGTHESDPAMKPCTDCLSFVNKNHAEQRAAVRESRQSGESYQAI